MVIVNIQMPCGIWKRRAAKSDIFLYRLIFFPISRCSQFSRLLNKVERYLFQRKDFFWIVPLNIRNELLRP